MEKKVLIVDSDRKQIERMAAIVKSAACNLGIRAVLFIADNVSRAENLLKRYDIDVMILDIIFKEKYVGVDLIKYVRATDKYAMLPVIIVTNAEQLKEYSYKALLCYGFCKKDCREEELYLLLKTALKYTTFGESDKQIVLRKNGVLYPVVLRDILYIKVRDHKMYFFLEGGAEIEVTNLTMSGFCEQHMLKSLVRCNRNVLVNRMHVRRIVLEEKYVMVKGCSVRIRIGSAFVDNLKKEFYIRKDGSVVI